MREGVDEEGEGKVKDFRGRSESEGVKYSVSMDL